MESPSLLRSTRLRPASLPRYSAASACCMALSNSSTLAKLCDTPMVAAVPAEIRAQGASGGSRWWLDAATTDAGAVRAAFPGAQDRDCAPR